MLIIINRLGIIGLFYAVIPLLAGLNLSFFVHSMFAKMPDRPAQVTRSGSGKVTVKPAQPASRAAAVIGSFVICAGLTVWAWFIRNSVIRRQAGGISAGGWNGIIFGTYILGIAFGAIAAFSI